MFGDSFSMKKPSHQAGYQMRENLKKIANRYIFYTTLIINEYIYFGNSFFNTEVTNVFPLLD